MARAINPLALLRSMDRERLLHTDDAHLLGQVMELNRSPRYHNQLDAVKLVCQIVQDRERRRQQR